ncbi:MAG: C4-dicarboxylate ABC transporter permease [Acidobacteria bacterium]|nr:MAG: C4-dicarboxylate ABC transporter permease [Acidobacteriota bacterium]
MTHEILAGTGARRLADRRIAGWRALFHRSENVVLSAALGAMAVLPVAEIILRTAFGFGIPGSAGIVQHLTLWVGMLGAAIAAREARLLSLSTGAALLKGPWKAAAGVFSGSTAAAVAALLGIASVQFVQTERDSGNVFIGNVPLWTVQLILPIGFFAVAFRLWRHSSYTRRGRAVAALLVGAVLYLVARPPVDPQHLVVPAFIALLLATALGAPVFTALGGAALILFWGEEVPIASIPVETYRLTVSPTLPTIPLFTLAGYFFAEGGASKRLVRVFQALAGWVRGGPAIATALVCAFFTSFTGASGVTILALGGLLMPVLLQSRYSERTSLGLLTACGSLGLLFPPSLPVILYGIVSHTPIDRMFLGGFLPGILMLLIVAWWGAREGARSGVAPSKFDAGEAWRAIREAKWELVLPLIVLIGLYGGFATLVEAAALTALYAFVVETFVYRDLTIRKDAPRVMSECGILVGGVLLILGVALGLTNYLIDAQVPARGVAWVRTTISSPLVFLFLLNLFLLVVGCLMDIFSAIVVVVPLIAPMGEAFGIDPVHLGIIFLANMELGYLTPPVGMNLFLSSYRFQKPLMEVCRAVVPWLLVLLGGVLIITYVPVLTTALPAWLGR